VNRWTKFIGGSAYPLGKLQLIVLDDACVTWGMIAKDLEHDPEKWKPVSRLREARFGGRRKVGEDHAQTKI
jgi:hypothetical protein